MFTVHRIGSNSTNQLHSAIAQVGGKKELTGRTDIAIEISNQSARLIANAIIYYNSAILSRLVARYEAGGNTKAAGLNQEDVAGGLAPHPPEWPLHIPEQRAGHRPRYDHRWAGSGVTEFSGIWAYTPWCSLHQLPPLPATPETVALYITSLSATHSAGTITRRLTSIAKTHEVAGHPSPATMRHAQVSETLKGIRRTLGVEQKGRLRC